MKMQIDTVIVDDDPTARELLYHQIATNHPHVNVVGEAANGAEAYQLIDKLNPDVVFLDMHMPGGSGIELIDRFKKPSFKTIFYSTFSHYALDAIKRDAFDYLLKPLDPSDLSSCLEKLSDKMVKESEGRSKSFNKKIELFTKGQLHYIAHKDIVYIQAAGSYSMVHTSGGKRLVVSKNLKALEELLDNADFCRVHNSYLVNSRKVQTCNFQKRFCVMIDGSVVKTAVRRRDQIKQRLQQVWSTNH